MVKLGTLLERQFKKLGIEVSEELKAIVALENEVPDELATKIDKGLLTMEAAKNNADLIKLFKQQTLAGADARMDDIIKEHGIIVDEAFANEKNTYEKIGLLVKAGLSTGIKKGEAVNKENISEVLKKERDAFAQKEADYNKKLADLTTSLTAKETEFTTTRESDLTSFELQKILLTKDYVFPKDMDNSIKVQTAMSALNKDLSTRGLKISRDAAGSLVITDKDGNKAYTEKHEPIEKVDSYIDGVLTHNKLLNINDPNQPAPGAGGSGGARTILQPAGDAGNQAILNEIEAQIAQVQKG